MAGWRVEVERHRWRWTWFIYHSGYGSVGSWTFTQRGAKHAAIRTIGEFTA